MKIHEFTSRDGFRYQVGSVGARDGLHCALLLARAAEPVLTAGGLGVDSTVAVVQALADPKFEDVADEVMTVMAKSTQVIGPGGSWTLSDVFDAHFAERYDVMLKWAAFAIRENLSSFFVGLAALDAEIASALNPPTAPAESGGEASSSSRKPAVKTG